MRSGRLPAPLLPHPPSRPLVGHRPLDSTPVQPSSPLPFCSSSGLGLRPPTLMDIIDQHSTRLCAFSTPLTTATYSGQPTSSVASLFPPLLSASPHTAAPDARSSLHHPTHLWSTRAGPGGKTAGGGGLSRHQRVPMISCSSPPSPSPPLSPGPSSSQRVSLPAPQPVNCCIPTATS